MYFICINARNKCPFVNVRIMVSVVIIGMHGRPSKYAAEALVGLNYSASFHVEEAVESLF